MKYTKLRPGPDGGGNCWVKKRPDEMAKEHADRGIGEAGGDAMERDGLDEQDREYIVGSELSGIYSRAQYLKVLLSND